MCSPVGHSLAALAVGGYNKNLPMTLGFIVFCLVSGNLADLDLLVGWALGAINEYHHLGSHSVFAAIVYGIMVWGFARLFNLIPAKRALWAVTASAMYLSHVLLDMLTHDGTEPIGVQLWWPFSNSFYAASPALFPAFLHETQGGDFVGLIVNLFNWHNFITVLFELCVLLPLLVIALWQRKFR